MAQKMRMGLGCNARAQPCHPGRKKGPLAGARRTGDVRDDRRLGALYGRRDFLDWLRRALPIMEEYETPYQGSHRDDRRPLEKVGDVY
eukprot:4694143-Pyramimonas_sp.AAC.1